jgi:hypothetical protein
MDHIMGRKADLLIRKQTVKNDNDPDGLGCDLKLKV